MEGTGLAVGSAEFQLSPLRVPFRPARGGEAIRGVTGGGVLGERQSPARSAASHGQSTCSPRRNRAEYFSAKVLSRRFGGPRRMDRITNTQPSGEESRQPTPPTPPPPRPHARRPFLHRELSQIEFYSR